MAEYRDFPHLPSGFTFGASTSAYQIEGAADEAGRGRSVWDTFVTEPGRVADGSSGAVACDHYHRYSQDVALMRRLGLDGYRFSVSWPRVQPEGSGRVNAAGLDFYDRLVDELLASGISPMVTLFHWDLPQALEDKGGWLNRETADRFAEYAALLGMRLGDRVAQWIPVNEPNVVTMLGYGIGTHAPGRGAMFDALPAAHHLLLAHGRAVGSLRATRAKAIGTATNHTPVRPASESPADKAAAAGYAALWNRLFADPVLLGRYPEGFASLMPGPVEEDLAVINAPLDFYGVNYYRPTWVADPAGAGDPEPGQPPLPGGLPFTLVRSDGHPVTHFGWPVVPEGLRDLLVMMHEEYGAALPPIYVTENGCSYDDRPDGSGEVHDPERIAYLDGHLRAVAQAIVAGVDVRGYFTWSLLDNFEWAEGFRQRFGLVHVDFETQERTPKDSYGWFAGLIRANRAHAG
jgi:beta-glucosidase